jgi:hypothetical protein
MHRGKPIRYSRSSTRKCTLYIIVYGALKFYISPKRTVNTHNDNETTSDITVNNSSNLMGLSDSPLCRKCGSADETSAHILLV